MTTVCKGTGYEGHWLHACMCLCFPHHLSTGAFVEEWGTYIKGQYVHACNLYMFVFIYPLETFFVEELGTYEGALCACLHMEGHYVHVYIWRGTLCMCTYGGAPSACLRPIMTPRGCNLCCLTLYIRAPWFYKYSRKIFTYIYDLCATIYKL